MLDLKRVPQFNKDADQFCEHCRPIYQKTILKFERRSSKDKQKIEKMKEMIKKLKKKIKNETYKSPSGYIDSENAILVEPKIEYSPSSDFIQLFVPSRNLKSVNLNNEIVEKYSISFSAIKRPQNIEEIVEETKNRWGLEKAVVKINNFVLFKTKGISSSVNSFRKEIVEYLDMRLRTIYRYLILPTNCVEKINLEKIRKESSEDELYRCAVKITPQNSKNAFSADLTKNGLSQIELIGFPNICDSVETKITAFVKMFLDEPDVILRLSKPAQNFFTQNCNKEKINVVTGCFVDKSENGGLSVFSGNDQSLRNSVGYIESLFTDFAKGKLTEKIIIKKQLLDIINEYFVDKLKKLNSNLNQIDFKFSPKELCLRSQNFEESDLDSFYRNADFIRKMTKPSKIVENINPKKMKLLRYLEKPIFEQNKSIIHLKRSETNLSIFIFSEKAEEASKTEMIIRKTIKKLPDETVFVEEYQQGAFGNSVISEIEKKFDIVVVNQIYRNRKELKAFDNFTKSPSKKIDENKSCALLIFSLNSIMSKTTNGVSETKNDVSEKSKLAADEIRKTAQNYDKTEPQLLLKLPKSRVKLLTAEEIRKTEEDFSVKIDQNVQDKSFQQKEQKSVQILGLYGSKPNCEKAEKIINKTCLTSLEPTVKVEITKEKAEKLTSNNQQQLEAICKETGCVIFVESENRGENPILQALIYGNVYACTEAERLIRRQKSARKADRILIVPESDLLHIQSEDGRMLKKLEERTDCEISIPSVLVRDPLDTEVRIGIFGDHLESLNEAEKGLRALTSLLSKVENKITRLKEIPKSAALVMEQNDSKLIFLLQDETRCLIRLEWKSQEDQEDGALLYLRGSQITCDAAEARINLICSLFLHFVVFKCPWILLFLYRVQNEFRQFFDFYFAENNC
ncbi:hypothetical protein MHBO_000400 [Bonamia ostreae]|uniref:KH domain-containing protein n=1 Tax=Bonamia ostreae TaxID=126728 RepID=A0ABV2AFJ2_9EUKA